MKTKRGQTLTLVERKNVLNVLEDFLKKMNKTRAVEACSKATGRSLRIIYKLSKENEQGILRPPKNSKKPHLKSHMRILTYKSPVRSRLRTIVHQCLVNNIPPAVNTILEQMNDLNEFPPFKRGTLYNLLRDIGFEFEKRGGKGIFVERKDILKKRHIFLDKIKEARKQNRTIVYTSELCIDSPKIWMEPKEEKDDIVQKKVTDEEKKHFVLIHAGCKTGFIEDAKMTLMLYKSKGHENGLLDWGTYENWFFNKLLPNCPKKSVIVMDNARHNTRKCGDVPDESWSEEDIIEWLETREIQVAFVLPVSELLGLVQSVQNDFDSNVIDKKCEAMGYEVLRLPEHHCELNPMDMVWDRVQNYIKTNDLSCSKEDVFKLINKSYESVTIEDWLCYIDEVETNESFLWKVDCLQENVDDLISKLV